MVDMQEAQRNEESTRVTSAWGKIVTYIDDHRRPVHVSIEFRLDVARRARGGDESRRDVSFVKLLCDKDVALQKQNKTRTSCMVSETTHEGN